jgi:acetylglutamate kinase
MNPTKPVLKVIKIGGNVIDNPKALADFLRLFASLEGPKVLIHGGGKIATQLAKDMGIESKMIDGRRVTDETSLRIVTMVYAGWINKSIVAALQAEGCTSLGLSGPDGGMVRAKKRNPIPVDYGFVGDIEEVNGKALAQLIEAGYAPIFAPITADASGQLLNTNADTMAQAIAIALSDFFQVNLVYCFEKPGVLRDPQDDHSVIPSIHASYFEELKANGTVTAGMIPKLENALKAISKGVHLVRLCLADHLMNENLGTNILP